MIGMTTFLLSAAGTAFGRFLGRRFGRAIEVAGGVCLTGIGIKIAIEHVAGPVDFQLRLGDDRWRWLRLSLSLV
jgi:hypothetical protein